MMSLENKLSRLLSLICLTVITIACNDDEIMPINNLELVTASGVSINPDGLWESGCATDLGMNLSEIFTFSGETLIIDIQFFEDDQCSNLEGTEKVTISYMAGETFQAMLNGQSVLTNKISGIATNQSDNVSYTFRQSFYIDDSGTMLKLYHGRFGDDGGELTDDGYPMELIAIPFHKI